MANSRIICPDCKTVLRPTKPVPDGKKVKCPECGNVFTTPGLAEDDARSRKKAAGPKKAAIKKAGGKEKASPQLDDDDEGGGIYAFETPEEHADGEKPDIEYAPDMSIKDLRGPAQAAVVRPSNYVVLVNGVSFLCGIIVICYSFWPMVFSDTIVDWQKELANYYKQKDSKQDIDRVNGYKEYKDLQEKDLAVISDLDHEAAIYRFIIMGIYVFMLIWNAITVVGGVKMQNLESRGWGIAAAVMSFFPFSVAGINGLLQVLLIGADYIFGGPEMGWLVDIMKIFFYPLMCFLYIFSIVLSVWCLRTLMSKEVIAGFEYVAD